MKFKYSVKTKLGERKKGILEADDSVQAKENLLAKDLILLSLIPVKEEKGKLSKSLSFFGVPFLDKILFVKHLSLMIKGGLSLRESISIIREQAKSKKFKKILDDVLLNIDNGSSLADSLSLYPNVFDSFYTSMIKAGEESGSLEENLGSLSRQLEKNYELRKRITTAMIYPAIIFTVLIVLSFGITFFILPKITSIFKSFRVELPLPTRILLAVTAFVKDYSLMIIIVFAFLFFLSVLLSRVKAVKNILHKIYLKTPLLGSMVKNINLVYLCRNLGVLLKSGVPLMSALEITETTLLNIKYQQEITKTIEEVKRGKQMSEYLKKKENLFPLTLSRMISVGEKTGTLEETLFYLANFFETEVDRSARNLSVVVEPLLLLVVGILVGFVSVAIISPIYEVTRSLHP